MKTNRLSTRSSGQAVSGPGEHAEVEPSEGSIETSCDGPANEPNAGLTPQESDPDLCVCDGCKREMYWGDEPIYEYEAECYCLDCAEDYADCFWDEARDWAEERCKLTGEVEEYDPEYHFACTPEDYEMGDKESYTPNSVGADNRHNATNYDEVIKDLDPYDPVDRIFYKAVRERIEELIEDRRVEQELKRELEDEGEDEGEQQGEQEDG